MNSAHIENKVLNIDKSTWQLTKLGDILKDISKRVDNPRQSGYDRFVGLEHFVSGDIKIKNWGTTENLTSSTKAFKGGDILFARRNAYLRRASLVDFDGCCSGDAFVLSENHDKVVPSFMAFFMNSNSVWDFANENAAGTMSKRVKWRDLANYEFLLPPKEQQAQLTELLWAMDEVIEREREVLEKFGKFIKSKTLNLLGFDEKVEGYFEELIINIAPLQRGFDLPNSQLKEGKFPVCFSNGVCKYHEKYMVKGPGVCTGRSGTIGNVFYIEGNYWPHNTTLWVTDFKGNYPKYIYYLFSNLNFKKHMAGTGVPTLNRNVIHKIKVRIPKFEKQELISEELDLYYRNLDQLISKISISHSLQKSLINQIF